MLVTNSLRHSIFTFNKKAKNDLNQPLSIKINSIYGQQINFSSETKKVKRIYSHKKNYFQHNKFINSQVGLAFYIMIIASVLEYNQIKRAAVKSAILKEAHTLNSSAFRILAKGNGIQSEEEDGLIKVSIPQKDLFALGGYSEILDNLADLVRYLQNPETFTEAGLKAPKGVILSGPPGVGKTFLAEAIAGHAGVPLILISGSDFHHKFVGVAEMKMRELFQVAEKHSPCVICIDEIDAIASKRIDLNGDESVNAHIRNSEINQMLALLSKDRPGVIVIATTNKYHNLDPALVRPGRFDRHLILSMPTVSDRKEILKVHLKDKQLCPDISLDDLASISIGFSGAKLAAWVNEAAISAFRQKNSAINSSNFDTARTMINYGVSYKRDFTSEQRGVVALHEAGHAVVGHLLNLRLYKISMQNYGAIAGYTEWILQEDGSESKQQVLDLICTSLAGRAAEIISGTISVGSAQDLDKAKALALLMVEKEGMGSTLLGCSMDVEWILKQEMKRAIDLLNENNKEWTFVKQALMYHDDLLREEFLAVIEGKDILEKKNAPGKQFYL